MHFPQRLKKPNNQKRFGKFLNTFKKLELNISFVKGLAEMPTYAKYLKDIITNKRRWHEININLQLHHHLQDTN